MLQIDADALFRAVTATGYKLLAYHLDLKTGAIISRTLRPDEVTVPPPAPSVKPLPKMGGDLAPKKDALPFGPLPVEAKKNLFADEGPKKPAFEGDFWKRDDKKKVDPFGGAGFQRESATRKLAEIFGDAPKKEKADPFAKAGDKPAPVAPKPVPVPAPAATTAPDDPQRPRIPALSDTQHLEVMQFFAKDSGDPEIREELLMALKAAKPAAAFERVLRKYQRTGQQWERYYRKQALAVAEEWLSGLNVQWELIENDAKP